MTPAAAQPLKAKGRKGSSGISQGEMDSYRGLIRENITLVRNMKQYLLTVLYNAPVTIESYYAARVNHDLYGGEAA